MTKTLSQWILSCGTSLKETRAKINTPANPSNPERMVPSIIGLARFFFSGATGSHRISWAALFVEYLKTWSENFAMNTADRVPKARNPEEPTASVMGRTSNPARIPNRVKIKPVTKNCIINVAAPVDI